VLTYQGREKRRYAPLIRATFAVENALLYRRTKSRIFDAIIETLSSATPVVAQTEYETPDYHVILEYPVKVVNFSERERYYQVDTGPILLPGFDLEYQSLLEGCRLAYVAHNCPEWAEFIVCVPTPLTETVKVHHYSESIRIDGTRNRMIAVI
jgi:hypothetical protein